MSNETPSRGYRIWTVPVLGLFLLVGMGLEKFLVQLPVEDASPYHTLVRSVAEQTPMQMGDWVGTDIPVPAAAVSLLKPNVLISRRFVNIRTGWVANVLLVQCRDTRDMVGHYPPVCYPGQGWTVSSEKNRNYHVNKMLIPAKLYKLVKSGPSHADRMIVGNFMIVPDGRLVRDMTGLYEHLATKSRRPFGAAQMQVVIPGSLAASSRHEVFRELVQEHMPLIQTILRGGY